MAAHQAPPSLGFSRQEHWSGLPFPSPIYENEIAQSCPTLSNPMDCSLPGSSVHGIFQARILEWGAIAFSARRSSTAAAQGNQPMISELRAVLWPPHAKSWLIGKDSDAGRDWGQEEKGTTGWDGWMAPLTQWTEWVSESEWTPGVGDGQGGLACCDSWGHKESDTTERLNSTELNWFVFSH